jgi:hypothetical protein
MYRKELKTDLPVVHLETESNRGKEKRLSDKFIRIGSSMFNIEIQSHDDNTMAVRLFEYGFRGAMQHDKKIVDEVLTITFPEPAVIYLRSENTPEILTVNIVFPHLNQNVLYTVPTRRMKDFTAEQLLEQNLIPLMPFYPMKFEHLLKGGCTDEDIQLFCHEEDAILRVIQSLIENNILTEAEAGEIFETLLKVHTSITKTAGLEDNEVIKETMSTMEKVKDINYKTMGNRTKKAEEKAEAAEKMIMRIVMDSNLPADVTNKYLRESGISNKRFEQFKLGEIKGQSPSAKID